MQSHTTSELIYFDCNAAFGRFNNRDPEARWSMEHLHEDLELAGIAGALVHHHLALNGEPMLGNLRLIEEIRPYRAQLWPCWVAMPQVGDAFLPADELADQLRAHDVPAVRVDPLSLGVPLSDRVWTPLLDVLRATRRLLLLPVPYGDWDIDKIDRFLALAHDVPVALVGSSWRRWRGVAALMEAHEHLHLEFSLFQANRAVEWFAHRFGPHRCLFGTGLPHRAPGAARGFLDFTLLPREQTALIAGGNLRSLLGAGPDTAPQPGQWHDAITAAVRHGQPLPCTVLDAHCHIGHDGCTSLAPDVVAQQGDAAGMLELIRRTGIDKTAIMSWAGPLCMDTELGNRIVADAVRRHPEAFIGVATINPDFDSPQTIDDVIAHYHDELGFPGLKTFTPYQTIDYDDPKFARWLQYANDRRLYLVFDPKGGDQATDCTRNLATRYPHLSIHLDHCGQSWPYARWAVAMLREHANLVAQLNFTMVTNGVIEYLVREVGAHRVLFGTDSPMRDPRPQAAWLTFTRLHEDDKRAIFGSNFQLLLDRIRLSRRCGSAPL